MSNASLPADLLEFKRLANSFGEFGLDKLLHRMIESGYKGPPFRMSPEKAQEFIALYGESNERVAKEVLGYTSPLFSNYGGPGEREGVELYGKLPVETLAKVVAFLMKELGGEIAELRSKIGDIDALLTKLLSEKTSV